MFTENIFCDVTLVSDDQKPFQAHKFVLSAFSPVLKNILLKNPQTQPLIYLRGVNHQELDSILKFIYLGKASVYHNNMNQLYQAAKDLQINQLLRILERKVSQNCKKDAIYYDKSPRDDICEDNENQTENGFAGRSISDILDKSISLDIPCIDKPWSGMQLYKCEKCEASYKHKESLYNHTRSKHEGICYSCRYCGYKATKQNHLKKHQESAHEGVIYSCDQCAYQASHQGNLKTHKKSVHEGIKYLCDQCDYHFTDGSSLRRHKKSVHEGVKYTCDHCDYQTRRKQQVKTHKQREHALL